MSPAHANSDAHWSGEVSQKESDLGILPSHGITLDVPNDDSRPAMIQHL